MKTSKKKNPDLPIDDKKLWFKISDCKGKHYFMGNPHTFHGRMLAWCPKKQNSFCVSKEEIIECSIESKYWIKGFICGNEPGPPKNKNNETAYETIKYKEWEKAIELFHETGFWYAEKRVCPKCKKKRLPSEIGEFCDDCK